MLRFALKAKRRHVLGVVLIVGTLTLFAQWSLRCQTSRANVRPGSRGDCRRNKTAITGQERLSWDVGRIVAQVLKNVSTALRLHEATTHRRLDEVKIALDGLREQIRVISVERGRYGKRISDEKTSDVAVNDDDLPFIRYKSKEEAWESDSDEDSDDDGEPLTLEEQAAVRALIEAAARERIMDPLQFLPERYSKSYCPSEKIQKSFSPYWSSKKNSDFRSMLDLSDMKGGACGSTVGNFSCVLKPHLSYGPRPKSFHPFFAMMKDGRRFVIKFSCRPPPNLHEGTQAASEVIAFHLGRLLNLSIQIPCSRGVVVSEQDIKRCDYSRAILCFELKWALKRTCNAEKIKGRKPFAYASASQYVEDLKTGEEELEKMLPKQTLQSYFMPEKRLTVPTSWKKRTREAVEQTIFDFIIANSDRRSAKNWFFKDGHVVAVDNGLAFWDILCHPHEGLLKCPGLIGKHLGYGNFSRGDVTDCLAQESRCGCASEENERLENCLYNEDSVLHLKHLADSLENDLGSQFVDFLLKDPLIYHLIKNENHYAEEHAYFASKEQRFEAPYSTALFRRVISCSQSLSPFPEISFSQPLQQKCTNRETDTWPLYCLLQGVVLRLRILQQHVDECVQKYGKQYVFQL
ncbi:uncharacterized protein [Oscarella lobularis]|uniref:uncharacterized protein isoform X2 n=1 Tax=Oscarella lobularis TaxID=121494 RepID=UPI003313D89E